MSITLKLSSTKLMSLKNVLKWLSTYGFELKFIRQRRNSYYIAGKVNNHLLLKRLERDPRISILKDY